MDRKVFELKAADLYEETLEKCVQLCSIQVDTERGKKAYGRCIETEKQFCIGASIKVIVEPFSRECVRGDGFYIGNSTITCEGLKELKHVAIEGGYMYAVYMDKPDVNSLKPLQIYYIECWLSAYVEVAWKHIRNGLLTDAKEDFRFKVNHEKVFVSESFAPGFGMGMNEVRSLFELMKLSDYGLSIIGDCVLLPPKSIMGIYLICSEL